MPSKTLEQLINRQQLWPAKQRRRHAVGGHSNATGFAPLDRALHQGGWPSSGSSEFLCDTPGIGELELVMPTLSQLNRDRPIAWLNPPYLPFAPGLVQHGLAAQQQWLIHAHRQHQLWAAEEALRSGVFGALLSWSANCPPNDKQLRRLHLAAREGHCWHLHFRPSRCQLQASPAPLRVQVEGGPRDIKLVILKQYGGHAGQQLTLPRNKQLTEAQRPVNEWPTNTNPRRRLAVNLHVAGRPSTPSSHPVIRS